MEHTGTTQQVVENTGKMARWKPGHFIKNESLEYETFPVLRDAWREYTQDMANTSEFLVVVHIVDHKTSNFSRF